MKEIFLLTKTLLKSSTNDTKKQGDKSGKSFGKILMFIFVYGYIIGFMSYLSYYAILSLILVNNPAIFLNLAFTAMLGFCIIQTVITSLNLLYFSKDLEFLLPLPLTPIKIVISKLNCLVISQYIVLGLLILPGIIIYGYLLNLEITYFIVAILLLLIFPLIPIAIVSGLVTLIMKFTKIIKNKEIVQYFSILLTIFLIIVISSFSGTSNNPSQEELANSLLNINGTIENISFATANISLIMNSILNHNNLNGLLSLIVLAIMSLLVYMGIAVLISKIYVKTVISLTTVKSKKSFKANLVTEIKQNSIFCSYLKKEIKLLVRTPVFFMQCVLPSIIFPIIIGVPAIFGIQDSGIDLELLRQDVDLFINSGLGIMCILTAILFMFVFNFASVTSVSRDGDNAIFMKYIPLDYKKQIFYKAFPGILLNLIPTIYIIMFCVIALPTITLKTIFYTFLISQIINLLNNICFVLIDLKNPKLKWITEYAVVKQNFNMIFVLFITALEILLVIVLGNIIKTTNDFVYALIILFLFIFIVVKIYINKYQEKILNKII